MFLTRTIMLCTAVINASRSSVRPAILARRVAAPSLQLLARYRSSKTNDEQALKAARKLNDKLQENWKGPILTYEQLKPKTLSPSNVWSITFCHLQLPTISYPGCLPDRCSGTRRSDAGVYSLIREPPTLSACQLHELERPGFP